MEFTASNEMNNQSTTVLDVSGNWMIDTEDESIDILMQQSNTSVLGSTYFKIIAKNNSKDILELKNKLSDSRELYNYFFGITPMDSLVPYTFKNKNQYPFMKSLLENFPITNFNNFITSEGYDLDLLKYTTYKLFSSLLKIDKGQSLLKLIPYEDIFNSMTTEMKIDMYFISGVSGTLPTFMMIDNIMTEKSYIDHSSKSILSASCRNADNRILKFILGKFDEYHNGSWNTEEFIRMLITNIFSIHIPSKYILRRLKMVNQKINLTPYFSYMLNYIEDIDTLMTINKYYNIDSNIDSNIYIDPYSKLIELVDVPNSDDNKIITNISKILTIFKSEKDNVIFLLNIFIIYNKLYNFEISVINNNAEINDLINRIVDDIFCNDLKDIYSNWNIKDLSKIFSIYSPDISKYCGLVNYNKMKQLLFMLPYIDYFPVKLRECGDNHNLKLMTSLNLFKFHIKVWMRKHNKIVLLQNKIKVLRTDIDKKVNNDYNMFTKLPPRHVLPMELNMINGNSVGKYLIREKADGCLVDFISQDVFPYIKEYSNSIIKAEFIEELDLYLIFDIKMNNMNIIERYEYIRTLHPNTCDTATLTSPIETFNDLKVAIQQERKNFEEFLKLPYKNYRVYPKAAWLVKSMEVLNKELIQNIISEKDYVDICEYGPYSNDGLVISPLDGSRELKVKPKSLHTLDLLFDGKNWIDREKNNWNHIISTKDTFSLDTIWRCYPTFKTNSNGDYLFEPKEYRFDKIKPNTNKIVNNIYQLHKINWLDTSTDGTDFFYHSKNHSVSKRWGELARIQNEHLENILENINPIIKTSWLDLGCGSSKLLNYIKKYHFIEYIGLDFDINQLLRGVKRIDINQSFLNNCRVIPTDLCNDWYSHKFQWDTLDKTKKFDYIVSNFSLSHFYNEEFWNKLEQVSKKDTYFVFNIVNNKAFQKWEDANDYLYIDGNTVNYYFESVHDKMMTEKYISEEEIDISIKKYNWNTVCKVYPDGNELDSKYTWYVLRRN